MLELEIALMLRPETGALIPGGKGLRKLRRPLAGRGKSGGARVIYYYISNDATIYQAAEKVLASEVVSVIRIPCADNAPPKPAS